MDLVSFTEARTINTRFYQERIFIRFWQGTQRLPLSTAALMKGKTAICAFSFTDAPLQTD